MISFSGHFGPTQSITTKPELFSKQLSTPKKSKLEAKNGNNKTSQHHDDEVNEIEDDGFFAQKKKHQKRTENEFQDWVEGADEPGPEVKKNPGRALGWWKVRFHSIFEYFFISENPLTFLF